jgi:hypothetical protein
MCIVLIFFSSQNSLNRFWNLPHADRTVFEPDSTWIGRWDIFIFWLAVYSAIVVSFRIGFQWFGAADTLFFIDIVVDLCFVADVALKFRTGFIIDGRRVTNPAKIRQRYLEAWFWVDVLAAFPLDVFQLALSVPAVRPIWRINKLLRLARVQATISEFESRPTVSTVLSRGGKVVLYSFLLLHFVACGWFLFGATAGFGVDAWAPSLALGTGSSNSFQYLFSFYVSLNLIGGVGNWVVPSSNAEFAFANICCLVGIFAFACTLLTSLHLSRAQYKDPPRLILVHFSG